MFVWADNGAAIPAIVRIAAATRRKPCTLIEILRSKCGPNYA